MRDLKTRIVDALVMSPMSDFVGVHLWVIEKAAEDVIGVIKPMEMGEPSDAQVAQWFHEAYERLAPSFGYETRGESAKPWGDVPEPNKSLMIAVAGEVRAALRATYSATQEEHTSYPKRSVMPDRSFLPPPSSSTSGTRNETFPCCRARLDS